MILELRLENGIIEDLLYNEEVHQEVFQDSSHLKEGIKKAWSLLFSSKKV